MALGVDVAWLVWLVSIVAPVFSEERRPPLDLCGQLLDTGVRPWGPFMQLINPGSPQVTGPGDRPPASRHGLGFERANVKYILN